MMFLQEMVGKDEITSCSREGKIAAALQTLQSMGPDSLVAASICCPSNI